eukprot:2843440-Amphidinium_carterae.1
MAVKGAGASLILAKPTWIKSVACCCCSFGMHLRKYCEADDAQKMLYPHIVYRNVTLQTHFGPTPLKATFTEHFLQTSHGGQSAFRRLNLSQAFLLFTATSAKLLTEVHVGDHIHP